MLNGANELGNIVKTEADLGACAEKIARYWTAQQMLGLLRQPPNWGHYSNKELWTIKAAQYYNNVALGGGTFTQLTRMQDDGAGGTEQVVIPTPVQSYIETQHHTGMYVVKNIRETPSSALYYDMWLLTYEVLDQSASARFTEVGGIRNGKPIGVDGLATANNIQKCCM